MDIDATTASIDAFTALLAAAIAVALVSRRVGFPYTVALVAFGLIVAVVAPGVSVHVTPDLVLLVLLPALVFEAAFHLDTDGLRRSLGAVVLLAVPGVLITALTVAVALHILVAVPIDLAFLVGAMVAATDPVAVIAAFRGAGGPHALRSMVEGESLFNDGTAIVLFTIALRVISEPVSVTDAVTTFAGVILVSVAIGAIAALLRPAWSLGWMTISSRSASRCCSPMGPICWRTPSTNRGSSPPSWRLSPSARTVGASG